MGGQRADAGGGVMDASLAEELGMSFDNGEEVVDGDAFLLAEVGHDLVAGGDARGVFADFGEVFGVARGGGGGANEPGVGGVLADGGEERGGGGGVLFLGVIVAVHAVVEVDDVEMLFAED